MSILVTITGHSEQEVEWRSKEMTKLLSSQDIGTGSCIFREEQAFLSSLPFLQIDKNIYEKSKRNVLTSGVAACYPFATLFTSFLSIKLVRLADRTEERVLPVPVSFILDEFPNIGVVPDFKKKLATARSRRIGMSILFQNIPQLQNRYPDNQWEEILGGCDFSIFLGCNDMTTATYYSDRTGEITVSVASIRKNFFTIRATDYVPEYSESRSIGKRQLLLPDEILRYPLDQGILIIRGHNVLRFKKMDYTEHADAGKLKMEKVVDHIPDWYRKWEKQQQEFQILDEQVYEASAPLEKNESPIKENDVQEPLTVNGAVQKTKNKKRTSTGNTVMKVDDLFVKKSKG